ncbi:MAG: hypothetical protein AB1730_08405 [Myxococcota bacterium]
MRRLLLVVLVVLAVLALPACTEKPAIPRAVDAGAPRTDAAPIDAGTELDQLEREVTALLGQSCTPCHAWSTWALVRTRSACKGGDALVVPFEPEASALCRKLSGAPVCGAPMPPTGRLPRGATEAVRAWIAAGAPVSGKVSAPLPPEPPSSTTLDWAPDPN